MPTVLLQQIIDLLTGFIEGFVNWANGIGDAIADIAVKVGFLEPIADDVDDIKDDVSAIKTNTTNANTYLASINSNTGSVVTPVTQIKSNTDTIATNTTSIAATNTTIANNMAGIAASASAAAAFDEDIANNTLNTYNKVVTIASDTTQMRADNQVIIQLLQDILQNM